MSIATIPEEQTAKSFILVMTYFRSNVAAYFEDQGA